MSMHEVEDIIEETVHLIDATVSTDAQKRSYLYNLYQLEYYFDTSYTQFRVMGILLKYHYVYKLPLNAHPDFKKKGFTYDEDGGWIQSVDQEYSVYAKKEEDGIFLYGNAGSAIWQHWVDAGTLTGNDKTAPEKLSVPATILTFMQLAATQQNKQLLEGWYALFVNSCLGFTFGENEGIPKNFAVLVKDKTILDIRELAQQFELGKKRRKEDDEDLCILPATKSEKELADTPDELYRVLFFLDLKKELPALVTAYKKASKPVENPESKIAAIKTAIESVLSDEWIYVGETKVSDQTRWLWYTDKQDAHGTHRVFLSIEYSSGLNMIYPVAAIQHALILKWQQRQPDDVLKHLHLKTALSTMLPEEIVAQSKLINGFGGWMYNIKKSDKILQTTLNHLTAHLLSGIETYYEFVTKEFPDTWFDRDVDEMMAAFSDYPMPEYLLFDTLYYIPLLFSYHYKDKGDKMKAQQYLEQAASMSEQARKRKPDHFLQPFFEAVDAGENPALPLIFNLYQLEG